MSAGPIPADAITRAVAAARQQLRIEGDGEAALLDRLAASAIALGEAFTGSVFVTRGCEDVLTAAAAWRPLMATPVRAIAGVTGLPADGAPFVLPLGDYAVDIDGDGQGWLRVIRAGAAGRVAVAYEAGLADGWDDLPAPLRQGTAALIAHLFEDRGATQQPPAAIAALWRPWRRMRLMAERHA